MIAREARDSEDKLLAVIVNDSNEGEPGVRFLTEPREQTQLATMRRPAGDCVAPHRHRGGERAAFATAEALFVQRGRVLLQIFDDAGVLALQTQLRRADFVLLLAGGHALQMLEETDLVEVKTGPWLGKEDKVPLAITDRRSGGDAGDSAKHLGGPHIGGA